MSTADCGGGSWTLLTGHGHVLVEIARNPEARIRDIAAAAGITERTAQAIVTDLESTGYITRARIGRRTRYTINPDSRFRHSAQEEHRVGPLLDLLTRPDAAPGPNTGGQQPAPAQTSGTVTGRRGATGPSSSRGQR